MLVSVDELRRYMGGLTPKPGLEIEMENILAGVQSQLETYLNRPVELVQVRETATSDGKGDIYLSVTPVRKVISYGASVGSSFPQTQTVPYTMTPDALLSDDGRTWDKVNYKLNGFTFNKWGLSTSVPFSWYVVEYVAGMDASSPGYEHIKQAIKRVAAREYAQGNVDTAGLRTGNVEQTETGDSRNVGWTKGELDSLQRYRRRLVL